MLIRSFRHFAVAFNYSVAVLLLLFPLYKFSHKFIFPITIKNFHFSVIVALASITSISTRFYYKRYPDLKRSLHYGLITLIILFFCIEEMGFYNIYFINTYTNVVIFIYLHLIFCSILELYINMSFTDYFISLLWLYFPILLFSIL